MILTIASPDKITISMFVDFYRSLYDSSVQVYDLNCLYSEEVIKERVKFITELNKNLRNKDQEIILVYYKMKSQTKNIPQILIESSDFLIKFDTYSTYPEMIKNEYPDIIGPVMDRWVMNIKKLNSEL